MKVDQETRPFTEDILREACIPMSGMVSLGCSGTWYGFNPLPRYFCSESFPDIEDFALLCDGQEISEIEEVTLNYDESTSVIRMPDGKGRDQITAASTNLPIAASSVPFCEVIHDRSFKVSELLSMCYKDGGLYLDGKQLHWHERSEYFPEYWIEENGRVYTISEYPWIARHPVFENLLLLKRNVLCPVISEDGNAALRLIRDDPDRWTEELRSYIHRHGRISAACLLGEDNLMAVLEGRLWEHLSMDSMKRFRPDGRQASLPFLYQ